MFEQLGLIGCGLMGGSFALALKQAGLVRRVVGYSKSQASAQHALELGVIDEVMSCALEAATGSDLILIAVPVSATESIFKAIRPALKLETLVMDVGSIKRDVVDAARRVLGESVHCFVPAHPITGREVSGVEHAQADLYKQQQVILTPIERTGKVQLARATELWQALGCKVRCMLDTEHDSAYAAVSHLPHLIAFALINSLMNQTQSTSFMELAGPGFRDFTRIAASDPQMWRDILIANREELLAQSKLFKDQLDALEALITNGDGDALEQHIEQASHTRAHWRAGAGKASS